jgi:hypothetical protein
VDRPYYHVALVVEDLDAAMAELTRAVGLRWGEPHDSTYGEWRIRVVYSAGPPFVELVQGEPGGPWDTTEGSHLDHIGYFSDDVLRDRRVLEEAGAAIDLDPTPYGRGDVFAYLRTPVLGARVELVTDASRDRIYGASA